MSGGKNRVKIIDFWPEGHEPKNREKLLPNIVFFFAFCLVKTLQIPVFLDGLR